MFHCIGSVSHFFRSGRKPPAASKAGRLDAGGYAGACLRAFAILRRRRGAATGWPWPSLLCSGAAVGPAMGEKWCCGLFASVGQALHRLGEVMIDGRGHGVALRMCATPTSGSVNDCVHVYRCKSLLDLAPLRTHSQRQGRVVLVGGARMHATSNEARSSARRASFRLGLEAARVCGA